MSDLNHIIEEANHLLEENNFGAARSMYQRAAMLASPTQHVLGNLHVAEEQERLQFRRAIIQKYPESRAARLDEIAILMSMDHHWYDHAIDRCTDLLLHNSQAPDNLHIRWLRLQAAAHRGNYKTFLEDFPELWTAGDTFTWAIRSRRTLVQELAKLGDPGAIPVLELLNQKTWLPLAVKEFLEAKIRELKTLTTAMQHFNSTLEGEDLLETDLSKEEC
jgi:hypothetical protein